MLSHLGYRGLQAAGIPALARRLHAGAVILAYHNVVRRRDDTPYGDPGLHLGAERLHDQLRWLAGHYRVVPLPELVARLAEGRSLRGLAALTFDDGYRGVLEHGIAVLRDLGLPATLFVVGHPPARGDPFWWDHPAVSRVASETQRAAWLSELRGDQRAIIGTVEGGAPEHLPHPYHPGDWAAIAGAMGDGIEIGAHSDRHLALTTLATEELEVDLLASRYAIEDHLGVRPRYLAYPYGLWDHRVRAAACAAGFDAAFTLEAGTVELDDDPWSLKRINIPASIPAPAFECWLAGLRR